MTSNASIPLFLMSPPSEDAMSIPGGETNSVDDTSSSLVLYDYGGYNSSLDYLEALGANENELDCSMFLLVMYVAVFGSMCAFGLVGNSLSFLVLAWEKHGHVATFLLQVMAVLDNLFLLTTGFSQILSAVTLYWDIDLPWQAYVQMLVWPLVHITQLATVWITVLIAFNRYVAICRPFQAPALCTMRRVQLQVAGMLLFCIVYCLPRFFEYNVVSSYSPVTGEWFAVANMTALLHNKYYNYVYENGLYTLIVFLAPLLILISLNVCLVRELWRARRRALQRQLPAFMTAEDQENNLTLVMIVIIIIFVLCQTPALLNNILFVTGSLTYACGEPYFYFYHVSNLFISANSSVNFVVYCIFRRQFRQRLRAFCRVRGVCGGRERDAALTHTDTYDCDGHTTSVYSRNSYHPTHV